MNAAIDLENCPFCGGHRTAEIKRFKGHENGDIYQYCDACGANTRFHPRKSKQKELREKYALKPVNDNPEQQPVNEPEPVSERQKECIKDDVGNKDVIKPPTPKLSSNFFDF